MGNFERIVRQILEQADIEVGGSRPWDVQTLDDAWYKAVASKGSLGLGEAYINGWWDAERLDQFIYKIVRASIEEKIKAAQLIIPFLKFKLFNLQTRDRAVTAITKHYDRGNAFYQQMLDQRMVYSCGYWRNAASLDEAQENKLDLVCQKIGLQAGEKVLDIGCGWGSFARFAAERYQAQVVGITLSKQQAELATQQCKGLPVEIRVQDYRDISETYDHIISIGMFEHVGIKNYELFFQRVRRCLRDDGLFLLHTIGKNNSYNGVDPWIAKYIFPGGELPSLTQISKALETRFMIEDLHNFGPDYDRTLMAWFTNFEAAWPKFEAQFGREFYPIWKYYLLSSAGAFRARDMQLWQLVLSKTGLRSSYQRPMV